MSSCHSFCQNWSWWGQKCSPPDLNQNRCSLIALVTIVTGETNQSELVPLHSNCSLDTNGNLFLIDRSIKSFCISKQIVISMNDANTLD